MTSSDLDLVGLRNIAEAALAEWYAKEPSMVLRRFHEATAPETVLALLDRIEELERKRSKYRARFRGFVERREARERELERRIEELERAISEIPKHCGGSFTADDGYTSFAVADGKAIKEILEGVKHDREDQ